MSPWSDRCFRNVFSQCVAYLCILLDTAYEMNFDLNFTPEINSKWIIDLIVKYIK